MPTPNPCKQCNSLTCSHKQPRQFSREHQQKARASVSLESLQAAGRAGWQATVTKHGKMKATRILADKRRSKPSGLERIVGRWLEELLGCQVLGNPARHEVEIDEFYADFQPVPWIKTVIEVQGNQWHLKCELRTDQPARDKRKWETLGRLGYTIVCLPEVDIKNGKARGTLARLFKQNELEF